METAIETQPAAPAPSGKAAVEVDGLSKRFGDLTAVDDISFSVAQGEIFGFLGPNGAGKSTTIQMLATLLKPTSGTARIGGFDVTRQAVEVRRRIGIVFQDPSLDGSLTAMENLRFHAQLYSVPGSVFRERSEQVLQMMDLQDRRNSLVKTFSGGMRRRLEIARGLLHHPHLLFLDEPTVGLDPQTRAAIWEYVRNLRKETGITVFMTTHYLDEAENCDRIAIMDHAKIVALDTPGNLKRSMGGDVIYLHGGDGAALAERLRADFDLDAKAVEGRVVVQVSDASTVAPRVMSSVGALVDSIEIKQPSLDDVFLQLTGRAIRDEEMSAKDMAIRGMRAHARVMGGRRR